MSKLQIRILVILASLALSVYFTFPLKKRINLGLDLQGGMHLVLRVDMAKLTPDAKKDAVVRAIEIIRNRIDNLGAGETVIQRQGDDQIIVQLPGVTDREKALDLLGHTAQLEFSLVNNDPNLLKEALSGKVPDGFVLKNEKENGRPILIEATPSMKGDAITDARVDMDSMKIEPHISFTLSPTGAKQFAQLTSKHVDDQLAIVVDGNIISAPKINTPIIDGRGIIEGNFDFDKASLLALQLRSGALPAPIIVEEERTIGPLLGKDSITSGIKATIVGLSAVAGFMLIYYLLAGFISVLALILNLFIITGTLGLLNILVGGSAVTLTLPGIAGIILTLGMAVDANVLINERIREEVNNGRPLSTAISNGYNRAFAAIFDSHITNLIAAFMLFQFGSGPVKGFAVTLSIGIISSLFTALYVTRTIFMILMQNQMIKNLPMMRLLTNTKIDFIKLRYFCFALSLLITIGGMSAFFAKKEAAYGIDFAGGQIQEYKFDKPVSSEEIREALKSANIKETVIQRFDKTPQNVLIRTSEEYNGAVAKLKFSEVGSNGEKILNELLQNGILEEAFSTEVRLKTNLDQNKDKIREIAGSDSAKILDILQQAQSITFEKIFKEKLPSNPAQLLRIEKVGPVVGKHLRQQAFLAIVFAMGGILLYIGYRFKHFDFALAGVIALIHDVLVALGLTVFFGHQVDLLVVTALMTIAGFSISDTIIIYDRVRENISKVKKYDLAEIINLSVNQTLSRTILTSLTVIIVVLSLFFLGGEVLHAFSLCLLIGFLTGTYSSVYVAAPLVLLWEKRKK